MKRGGFVTGNEAFMGHKAQQTRTRCCALPSQVLRSSYVRRANGPWREDGDVGAERGELNHAAAKLEISIPGRKTQLPSRRSVNFRTTTDGPQKQLVATSLTQRSGAVTRQLVLRSNACCKACRSAVTEARNACRSARTNPRYSPSRMKPGPLGRPPCQPRCT